MRLRFLLPLGVVVLLIGLLAVGLRLNPREVPSPLIDKPAPAFSLPVLRDRQRHFSNSELRGDVTLVNVWASWCESCREEQPLLTEIARQNVVTIYGLNYKDSWDDAIAWLDRFGDPYRLSGFDAEGNVGIDWGVYGVPETFILDREGRIRYKHVGAITMDDWQQKLLPLIQSLRKHDL